MSSKHPALPFQFQRAIFFFPLSQVVMQVFSSDTFSFTIHAHCLYTLIPKPLSCIPFSFFFLSFFSASPNCNFEPHNKKICLHHSISHSANGLRLLVCVKLRVTSRAGCHLFSRRYFVCSLQHSSSSCYPLHVWQTRRSNGVLDVSNHVNIL